MRTRIAQHADGTSAASVHSSTTHPTSRAHPRRRPGPLGTFLAAGGALIASALIAAACLGSATAGAAHRSQDAHQARAASIVSATANDLAFRARIVLGMRWLTAWKSAHPAPPPPPPPPPPAPAPVLTDATSTTTPDWACIRIHESGDRFNSPTAPGGAYGFLEGTWLSLGYSGWPYEAPAWEQDKAVLFLYNELGWQPWSTRFVCGL